VTAVRPRIVKELVRAPLSDSESVISVRGGNKALIVNAVGDAVLDLCDGSRSIDDIAAFLRDNLSVPEQVDVERDVGALVDELLRAGMLEAVE
jgi:hypothetical protein